MSRAVLSVCLVVFSAGAAASASDPASVVTELLEAKGCIGTESEMFEAVLSAGFGISDAQATIVNMANSGALIWNGTDGYILKNTGSCP